MSYQITSDNIDLSPSMTELAKEKLSRIEGHLPDYMVETSSFRVVMNTSPVEQFSVKIEAVIHGKTFFADETRGTLESALVSATEDLDRQIERHLKKEKTDDWEKQREQKRSEPEE